MHSSFGTQYVILVPVPLGSGFRYLVLWGPHTQLRMVQEAGFYFGPRCFGWVYMIILVAPFAFFFLLCTGTNVIFLFTPACRCPLSLVRSSVQGAIALGPQLLFVAPFVEPSRVGIIVFN